VRNGQVKQGKLYVQVNLTNPVTPMGVIVMVDGEIVAALTGDQVKAAALRIDELQVAQELCHDPGSGRRI